MYSFLLVDDESYIRSAIAKLVDWKSLGIDKVFQAENGLEAQDIIKNEKIDIVLSDIEMPNMDGLVLSKWICDNHPSITVAILTGHERFDYAKQCMEYGVKQYLLKPVGVHSIQTKISQIVDELDKKRIEKERVEDLQNQIDESKSVLKDKIFYRLVCTPLGIQDSMETRFEYLGVHFDFSFNAVAIFDSNYNFASCKNLDKFLSQQATAIKLVIGDKHIVFNVDSRYSVVIFDINTITGNIDRSEKAISQMLYNKVNDVKIVLEEDSGLEITCGIGAPCNKMEDLFSSFSQAKTALSYQVSLGTNKIYDINDMSKFESSFYYPENLIDKLVHSIMFDSVEIIEETLVAINHDMMKNHSLSPENIQMINVEIITHIFKELYKVKILIQAFGRMVCLFIVIFKKLN